MFYFYLKIRSLGILQSTFSKGPHPPFSALFSGTSDISFRYLHPLLQHPILQPPVSTKGKWGAVLQLLGENETESLYAHFASAISPYKLHLAHSCLS